MDSFIIDFDLIAVAPLCLDNAGFSDKAPKGLSFWVAGLNADMYGLSYLKAL